jgi:hypothetical protein
VTSAVDWKMECRAHAVEWATRLESFMPVPPEQRPELDKEWKAFCVGERAQWLETHEMPSPVHFAWSASACFDAYEMWVRDWHEHIARVGDAWLAQRGLRVAEWHSRRGEGLRIIPITHGPAFVATASSAEHVQADCPTRD